MELLTKMPIAGPEAKFVCDTPNQDGPLTIFLYGELSAENADNRFCLRFNDATSKYKSFVLSNGDDKQFEWETSGLYLGRTAWAQNASLSIEYTVSPLDDQNKCNGHGLSTFTLSDDRVIGYTCHGYFLSAGPIRSLSFCMLPGGVFKGYMLVYKHTA